MVLKSHKGIYMQLESGKIIAIRTAMKPENGAKKPADQPSTSTSDKPSTDSKTDTDDDDLIMTSITYPEPKVANNEIGVAPTQPGMYVNGSAAKPEPARRRGRPPTYNGYHPAYIPPGAVVQPLQPYSRAPTFKPAASYGKFPPPQILCVYQKSFSQINQKLRITFLNQSRQNLCMHQQQQYQHYLPRMVAMCINSIHKLNIHHQHLLHHIHRNQHKPMADSSGSKSFF